MNSTKLRRPRRLGRPTRSSGQSLVEFALILPLVLILVMGIVDFARLYTTMLTVESAAREAADYGAFYWWNWQDADSRDSTRTEMQRRVCVASRNLPDYVGDATTCTNPAIVGTPDPVDPPGQDIDCYAEPDPGTDPCRLTVTVSYVFHLFAPLNLELFGVQLGLPSTLSFTRDSTFAISSFELDEP